MSEPTKKKLNGGGFIKEEKITIKVRDEKGNVIHQQTIISEPGNEFLKNILDQLNPKKE